MAHRTGLDRPPTEDPVPRALDDAIAAGWRGLTVVTGRDTRRPVTLVHAGPGPSGRGAAKLSVAACRGGEGPIADRLVLRLGGERWAPAGGPGVVLDLRLSAVRGLVRAMARAAELPLIDLSGACAVSARTAGIALGPAAGILRAASARAGEWHATDPGGGLAASIRFRLERSGRLPRLMSGARLADPPALVVPAGGPGAGRVGLADLAGAIPAGCALQSELLERAAVGLR